MENWDKSFAEFLTSFTDTVEQFFEEAGQVAEEITRDLQGEIVDELELFWREVIEPFLDIELNIDIHSADSLFDDFLADELNPRIQPSATYHPACINCRHFHGRIYGGTPLICGMHPYGWEGERCPDWEKKE